MQQVTLSNWAAGGASSFALNSGVSLFANYKKRLQSLGHPTEH
ncbi:DUF3078 domain-containing protein [Algoriphagus boritolerans]